MEFTVQNLEYAISVFYNSQDNERVQAHQWLNVAQQSPEAWQFIWELLQPTKATVIQFYGATTLHTKLVRCWRELPESSYEELKNKILQTILSYSKGPKIILNRLCISLAAFILQLGGEDLVATIQPLSSSDNVLLLLDVLAVIPEEYKSMTMTTNLRRKNRLELQKACFAILDDLMRYFHNVYSEEPPSEETLRVWCSAAECATNWLTRDKEWEVNKPFTDHLPLCNVLLKIVQVIYMHNEVVSDTALETCEAVLNTITAVTTATEGTKYPQAAIEYISSFAEVTQTILKKDNVPNSINEELLSSLTVCAVSLAEHISGALVKAIQDNHEGARLFLEILLALQSAPGYYPIHETRSSQLFGWWYTLQDEILNLQENKNKQQLDVWKQVYSQLLTSLIRKCEAPAEEAMTRDDAELLRCYRQDVADAVVYCYCLLGNWCWELVYCTWREATTDAAREAALHVFEALADAAALKEPTQHLVLLLQQAIEVASSSNDTRLLNTALGCLGAYSTWLSTMSEGPVLAAAALRASGAALNRSPHNAALALKKLSTVCPASAAPLAGEIIMCLKNMPIDDWVRRQLVSAAGAALSCTEPTQQEALLSDLIKIICSEMQHEPATLETRWRGAQSASALLTSIESESDIGTRFFRTILPLLVPYTRHEQLSLSLYVLLSDAITTLQDNCIPMLDDIAQLIINALEVQACTAGFDTVRTILISYNGQWAGCGNFLRSSVNAAYRSLTTDSSSRPEAVTGLYTMLFAVTRQKFHNLDPIQDMFAPIIVLAIESLEILDKCACKAAARWLCILLKERPAVLYEYGPLLTQTVLRCIGGSIPRAQVECICDVLVYLNKAQWDKTIHPDGLTVWLAKSLEEPNFPTPHATVEHKTKFKKAFAKDKECNRRLKEAVNEFTLACRGLIGSEYARQTQNNFIAH